MKKFLILILGLLVITTGAAVHATPSAQQEEAVQEENEKIPVIAWFTKGDTAEYAVSSSVWQINGTDSVRTIVAEAKIRINVVDSTESGYKMNYTVLSSPIPNMPSGSYGEAMKKVMANLSEKFKETNIQFETDDCGSITEITNLEEINDQITQFIEEIINGLTDAPEIKKAVDMGIDVKSMMLKIIPMNKLLEEYLKELQLLFAYHGYAFPLGIITNHEEATDSTYEKNEYYLMEALSDAPSNDINDITSYSITNVETYILPQSLVRELLNDYIGKNVTAIAKATGNELTEEQSQERGSNQRYDKDRWFC